MSFNWQEYLQLAHQLVGQDVVVSDEAKQRAAISRAYYAVYNEARKLARRHGFKETQLESHRGLIEYFSNEPLRTWKSVGANLQRLREWRNKADYDPRFARLSYETQIMLSLATTTLNLVDTLQDQ